MKRDPKQINFIDNHVGIRIKKRRNELNYSQDDLGRKVSLTFQQIQKYEKGINRVSSSKLFEIAEAMTVEISYFFDGLTQDNYTRNSVFEFSDSAANDYDCGTVPIKEIRQLVKAFSSISDDKIRKDIYRVVKGFAKQRKETKTSQVNIAA